MRRHLSTLLAFTLIFSATIISLILLSNCTSALPNGAALNENLRQPVEITGLKYDTGIGGYVITLHGISEDAQLALALNNRFLDIYQDGIQLLKSSVRGDNQYLTALPINKPQNDGTLNLTIYTSPPAARYSLLSYSGNLKPSIWLGDAALIDRFIQSISEMQLLLLGAYIALFCSFLLFYMKKKNEGYLLNAALIALAQGLITISLMNTQLIHLPYSLYLALRSAMYNVPLVLIVYICMSSYKGDLNPALSKLITPGRFFLLTLLAISVSRIMKINMYQLMRRLYILPVVFVFSCGIRAGRKGALSLFATYAIAEGMAHYLSLIDVMPHARRGIFAMFLRPSQYQYLPFLVCYLTQSIGRFTHDFIDTELSLEQNQLENSRFDALVKQRTRELVAEQQRRSNMMLKIFHDLRSPIFVMKSGLSHLNLADDESRNMLESIQSRLSYMERLTENLFMSAKLDENEVMYDMDYVRLDTLLKKITSSASVMAQERNIQLSLEVASPCNAWGDAFKLQQAIFNLIDNAIFYSKSGGRVEIRVKKEERRIEITVSDNGVGIASEDLDRIFERYYRSGSRKQSSGLGLYIAREIIEKHGGSICVHSILGQGSEFVVILPECEDEEATAHD